MNPTGALRRRLGMVGIVSLITALVSLVPVGNAQADDLLDWINYNTLNELKPVILSLQNNMNELQNSVNDIVASDQATTRFTPPVHILGGAEVRCDVVNVT